MDRGAWWPQSMELQRIQHDWATNTFTFNLVRFHCYRIFLPDLKPPECGHSWEQEVTAVRIRNSPFFFVHSPSFH